MTEVFGMPTAAVTSHDWSTSSDGFGASRLAH
jgi:hypothetical protein